MECYVGHLYWCIAKLYFVEVKMRKVILYIAMSLDGFIADKDGGVGWLSDQDENNQNFGSYSDFIKTIDTVILGYKTYHQLVTELSSDKWFYSGMKSYVLTHKDEKNTSEIVFTTQNPKDLVLKLKEEQGKDIWICGGASIANQLIKLNLIDRYHITIIPTILGSGVRLFNDDNVDIKLKLISTENYNGMTDIVYEIR